MVCEKGGDFVQRFNQFVQILRCDNFGHGIGIVDTVSGFVVFFWTTEEPSEPLRAVVVESGNNNSLRGVRAREEILHSDFDKYYTNHTIHFRSISF